MNSLEFIDKEIANIRDFLALDDVLCLQTEEDYKFWYDRLKTLQQIKAELEAWEIAKAKEVDILDVKTSLDLETFNLDLVKTYQLTDYEYKTLKKALGVE